MAETPASKAEFVMEFVSASHQYREQYVERWIETLDNFTLSSSARTSMDTATPFRRPGRLASSALDSIYLRDPETHKAIMMYAAKLVRALLGNNRCEYVQAEPVGWEDAVGAAPTVTRLLRRGFSLPGHFRTLVEAIIDALLFNPGIIEVGWRYQRMELPVIEADVEDGMEMGATMRREEVTVHDDVDLTVVDPQHFFPDPGEYRIERMRGAAKRFKESATHARFLAQNGFYNAAAVERAFAGTHSNTSGSGPDERWREGLDQPYDAARLGRFRERICYTYRGDVPWIEDDGTCRRELTVIDGELVRDVPWSLADCELPWKTLVITPMAGRFYGPAPAEVVRFDQDFADVLKELIARAVIRKVHPPIVFDPADPDLDPAMLRRWYADMPIPSRGGAASVRTLEYGADINSAMGLLQFVKQSIQEGTGALGGIMGEPGPDREAATVGAQRISMALDRPELAAMVLERDSFPMIGKAILRRYQQFIRTPEDLQLRIGQMPDAMWVDDIRAEFDVIFTGSRNATSKQQKLQSWQTFAQLGSAFPLLMAMLPIDKLAQRIAGDLLELPEIAAEMPGPEQVAMQAAVMGMMGPGGPAANGVGEAPQPAGLMPAQAAGGMGDGSY